MLKLISGWVTFFGLLVSLVLLLILGIDSYVAGITPMIVEDEILIFGSFILVMVAGMIYLFQTRFWEVDNPAIRKLKEQIEEAKLKGELRSFQDG